MKKMVAIASPLHSAGCGGILNGLLGRKRGMASGLAPSVGKMALGALNGFYFYFIHRWCASI